MAWYQRSARPYLRYIGHATRGLVRLDDGSLLAMWRLRGVPHELAAPSERNAAARTLNTIYRNIADDNVTLSTHLVRHKLQVPAILRRSFEFHNPFAGQFNDTYRDRILEGQLYRNDWFLSVVVAPRVVPVGSKKFRSDITRMVARFRRVPEVLADISQIEEIGTQLAQGLADYGLSRLELRERVKLGKYYPAPLFSEIAEALRLILTTRYEPVPLVGGLIGNSIYTDQAVFERRIHRILPPGVEDEHGARWGVIFGLREYMDSTNPGMMDEVLRLNMPLVLSQSFGFMSRSRAIGALTLKRSQMKAAGDPATKQRKQLKRAASQVGGGENVRGAHHISLAVYADSYAELVSNAAVARTALANSGAVVVPETAGNEAAYFAQLPGNAFWRTRPGAISSRNFVDFSSFGAFPAGSPEGRWGSATLTFKTTAGTAYDFIPHVGDVGMTAIFGRVGSGKTVLLMTLLAMLDQSVGDDGVTFFFDKDRGGELLVRAVGGSYLSVRAGEESGLAPLVALSNTSQDRLFLGRLITGMILLDGLGPLPASHHAQIARGVAAIMRKPATLRSFAGLRQYLDWSPDGAGARLERWCRGGALGWLLDGKRDKLDISARIVGIDLTAILDDETLVQSTAQYLLYRIRLLMDGRRGVLALDEAHAYMPHEQFKDLTEDCLLTARKNEWIVILCTQQPEHLLKGSFGTTVVNQCMTKFVYRNPTADKKVWCGDMHFTAGEFFAISEGMLAYEVLLKRESGSAILNFDLSPLPDHLKILSGRASTVREADRLREAHGDAWKEKFMVAAE